MVQNLKNIGFTVIPFGQDLKNMSQPIKELMKLTLEGKLAHGGLGPALDEGQHFRPYGSCRHHLSE